MANLQIHEYYFHNVPCDTWGCRNALKFKKYAIGRPDVNVPKPVFCEECIRNMLANIPAEFLDEAATKAVENAKSEVEKQYLEQIRTMQEEIDKLKQTLVEQARKVEAEAEVKPVEPDSQPEPEEPQIFRCLDCGKEFDSRQKLASHRNRAHQ